MMASRIGRSLLSIRDGVAILLIGGDKTGKDRWYAEFVPRADKIYAEHLRQLEKEDREKR